MAWSSSLLDCSFRGVVFDVLKTEDSAERASAVHEYPYLDGADVEDLGRGARKVSLEAKLWDGIALDDNQSVKTFQRVSGYEARLQALLAALDAPGAGELIHPVFGTMQVQVVRYVVRHEADDVDACSVHIEFIETTTETKGFFSQQLASQKAETIAYHGQRARTALGLALAELIDDLRSSSSLAALENLRAAMMTPLIGTFADIQGVLLSSMDGVRYPRAWLNDISSVVDGVLDLKDFATSRWADWVGVGNVLGRFDVFSGGASAGAVVAPGAPITAAAVPSEAQAVAAVQVHLAAATAVGVANAAGALLVAEADHADGFYLSPPEIEQVVAVARTRIEAALVAIRALYTLELAREMTEPLKDQALAIQEAGRSVIEARPPLLLRRVTAPGNFRLLAHFWYGDHTRAGELARLNPGVRLPNAIQFGDELNAYAS